MTTMSRIKPEELRQRMQEKVSKNAQEEVPKPAVPKPPPVPPKAETLSKAVESKTTEPEPTVEISIAKKEGETNTDIEASVDTGIAKHNNRDFHLDQADRLQPELFPHQPMGDSKSFPSTIPNLRFMLDRYGIKARYNVIKKATEFVIPGLVTTVDNAESIALTQIKSLARQNGMSVTGLEDTIMAIADRNQYNPVANWIKSKPWDGHDRLQSFYDTLTEREDFPNQFKELLIKRWMISGVAANFEPGGFKSRGVLTIQGPQSAGKTSWIAALIPDPTLRESSVKLDHHLDAGNKDSQIAAATHFLIEIGELESSFRRDVARLKGFITSDCDKIRLPYARSASVFPRRSVFAATVNDTRFLVDTTGNTRWWVIPVTKINYQHQLDMQQIWAQFTVEYEKGEQWWLTPEEEGLLEMLNRDHRVVSVIEERLMPVLDLSRKNEEGLPAMTPTEVLMKIGYKTVINQQAKECGALLREHLGEPKKIQGYMKWRIPFAKQDDIVKIEDY